MFKLESYITPWILGYLDRYIKNCKAEDSQVSLFSGEAVFSNLDLRLDVLEEEFSSLPFSFVNGHIHELRIQIPWTRLYMDPICITINTIECVLKLREKTIPPSKKVDRSASSASLKKEVVQEEAPPGYVQSLLTRLLQNICIVCNNLILKYVEGDLVLSLNARSMSWQSATDQWKPGLSTISAPDFMQRKLFHLTDLTICLDKRDAAGKIQVYQDPVAYRCSIQGRFSYQYESAVAKRAKVKRIAFHCKDLNISLTDVQIPMFARLCELVHAYVKGDIGVYGSDSDEDHSRESPDENEGDPQAVLHDSEGGGESEEESWGGWAWGFIPTLGWSSPSDSQDDTTPSLPPVFQFAFYFDSVSWIFKVVESYKEERCESRELLCLEHKGSFVDMVDVGYTSVRLGIQEAHLSPLSSCACGCPISENEEAFITMGYSMEGEKHLTRSLFDANEEWTMPTVSPPSVSGAEILEASPGFAFHYLSVTKDVEAEDRETKETHTELNFFLGSPEVFVDAGLCHGLCFLYWAFCQGDYEPYGYGPGKLQKPKEETFSTVIYRLSVLTPVITLRPFLHPRSNPPELVKLKRGQHKVKRAKKDAPSGLQLTLICKSWILEKHWGKDLSASISSQWNAFSVQMMGGSGKNLHHPVSILSTSDVKPLTIVQSETSEGMDIEFTLPNLSLTVIPLQVHIIWSVVMSLIQQRRSQHLVAMMTSKLPEATLSATLHSKVKHAFLKVTLTSSLTIIKACIHEVSVSSQGSPILDISSHSGPLLEFLMRFPPSPEPVPTIASVCFISVSPFKLFIHPNLITFFSRPNVCDREQTPKLEFASESESTFSIVSSELSVQSQQKKKRLLFLDENMGRWIPVIQTALVDIRIREVRLGVLSDEGLMSVGVSIHKFALCSFNLPTDSLFPSSAASSSPYGNADRDGFPWAFKAEGIQLHASPGDLLTHSLDTQATLGLTSKQGSPLEPLIPGHVALCLHVDMSPLPITCTQQQALTLLKTWERMLRSMPARILSTRAKSPSSVGGAAIPEFGDCGTSLSWFVQWTIPRATLELKSADFRLTLSVEELSLCIDFEEEYSKVKLKMSSVHGIYHMLCSGEWKCGDHDGLVMTSTNHLPHNLIISDLFHDGTESRLACKMAHLPFLEATFTCALSTSIYRKYQNVLPDDVPLPPSPSDEIQGSLCELDAKIQAVDWIFSPTWLKGVIDFLSPFLVQKEKTFEPSGEVVTYWSTYPLFYLHVATTRFFFPTKDSRTFLLLQVTGINVTSQVENPLPRDRVVISPDIFQKSDIRLAHSPCWPTDERQYEAHFTGITFLTGEWLGRRKSRVDGSQNPALEWNEGEMSFSWPFLSLLSLMPCWDMRVTLAPPVMSCDNGKDKERILICGGNLELNCITEITIQFACEHLAIIKTCLTDLINVFPSVMGSAPGDSPSRKVVYPSKRVPWEVLVTGNALEVSLYQRLEEEEEKDCHKDSGVYSDVEPIPPQEHAAVNQRKKYALEMHAVISQPHTLLYWSTTSEHVQTSLFNLSISLSDDPSGACLETRHGQPDVKTGILPSFLTCTWEDQKTLTVEVSRPFKLFCTSANIKKFQSAFEDIRLLFPSKEGLESPNTKSTKSLVEDIQLSTSQIVLISNNFATPLVLSMHGITGKVKPNDCQAKLTLTNVLVKMQPPQGDISLLEPWTCELLIDFGICSPRSLWLKSGDIMCFTVGKEQIQALTHISEQLRSTSVAKEESRKEGDSSEIQAVMIQETRDDLRSDRFRMVKDSTPFVDLQAGEFTVCNKEGSLTWAYQEPRIVSKIEVSPIPLPEFSHPCVTCLLQRYSKLHHCFVTYVVFQLSETNSSRPELPDVTMGSGVIPASTVWRIVMQHSIDDAAFDMGLIVPKMLAGCLRVDSLFSESWTSSFQLSFSISSVSVHLIAERHILMPPLYKGFIFENPLPSRFEVVELKFSNVEASLIHQSSVWSMGLKITGACNALKYSHLVKVAVIEPFQLEMNIDVLPQKHLMQAEASVEQLKVNVSRTALQAVAAIVESYQGQVKTMFINYIICNATTLNLRLGQMDTEEIVALRPNVAQPYAWRSQKGKAQLRLCIDEGIWEWCKPFSIDVTSSCIIRHVKGIPIFISINWNESGAKEIIVYGQTIFVNLTDVMLRVIASDEDRTMDAPLWSSGGFMSMAAVHPPKWIQVQADNGATSESTTIPNFEGKDAGMIWQDYIWVKGDSPLELSVSLIRERDKEEGGTKELPQFLCTLSPAFMVKSFLPVKMVASIFTPSLNSTVKQDICGRGTEMRLSTPCLANISHQISFALKWCDKMDPENTMPPVPLIRGLIDQIPGPSEQQFKDGNVENWLTDLIGNCHSDSHIPWNEAPIESAVSLQPQVKLQVSYKRRWPLCQTIILEVRPELMFMNLLLDDMYLMTCDHHIWTLPSRASVAHPPPQGGFHICFMENGILRENVEPVTLVWELPTHPYHVSSSPGSLLPDGEDASLPLSISFQNKEMFFLLSSQVKDGVRILSIHPRVIISNKSSMELIVTSVDGFEMILEPQESQPMLFWKMPCSLIVTCARCSRASDPVFVQLDEERNPKHYDSGAHVFVPLDEEHEQGTLLFMTRHWRGKKLYLVFVKSQHPQCILHNLTASTLFLSQGKNINLEQSLIGIPKGKSYPFIPSSLTDFGANITSAKQDFIRVGFSVSLGSLEKDWSQEIALHEEKTEVLLRLIHTHGKKKVIVEKIGRTTHIIVSPLEKREMVAEDVRQRIAGTKSPSSEVESSLLLAESGELRGIAQRYGLHSPETFGNLWAGNIAFRSLDIIVWDETQDWKIIETLVLHMEQLKVTAQPTLSSSRKLKYSMLGNRVKEFLQVAFAIGDIQLYNQLWHSERFDFPAILAFECKQEKLPTCFLGTLLFESLPVGLFLQNVEFELQRNVKLFLEDTLLNRLMEIWSSLIAPLVEMKKSSIVSYTLPSDVSWVSDDLASPLVLNHLLIHPVNIELSAHASLKFYLAINRMNLNLPKLDLQNIICLNLQLGSALARHYMVACLFRAGWVIGSMEVLGSPTVLLREVRQGLGDLVCLPYQGLLRGPWGFLLGISHGTVSLFQHMSSGALQSMTNMASSIARNLESLSLDPEYQQRAEEIRRAQASSRSLGLVQSLSLGFSEFGISLLGAVGGLAHHPLQCMMEGRPLVVGLGRGMIGIMVKPLGGAAQLISYAGQGILTASGWPQSASVCRIPEDIKVKTLQNAEVKVQWKLNWRPNKTERQLGSETLAFIDASLITNQNQYIPVCLLLFWQELVVVNDEEDSHQMVLELSEWQPLLIPDPDPTLVVLRHTVMDQQPLLCEVETRQRVADYVGWGKAELEATADSCTTLRFHLSPNTKNFFLAQFHRALDKLHQTGFPL